MSNNFKMHEKMEALKKKAENNEILYGTHIFSGDPSLSECIAQIGYDILWIDMEHTAIDKTQVLINLIAARSGGTPAFVRIPWNDAVLAKPILDMGAEGIIFPYIRTAADAKTAVRSCEYPHLGQRGYGPLRALNYNAITPLDYVTTEHKKMWRILQIEHIDAVDNLEEIVSVEGIDAYIVGPNDLSASVGHIADVSHPEMMPVYDLIGEIMQKHKKLFGVSTVNNPKVIREWLDRGAKIIFTGSDTSYVYNGAVDNLNSIKKICE